MLMDMETSKESVHSLTPTVQVWKKFGKSVKLMVNGDSMKPLVLSGDNVSLRFTDGEDLRMGDIFIFLDGENTVVHRYIKKKFINNEWLYCEKGDNCINWSWITSDLVLGKVEIVYSECKKLNMLKWPWTIINPMIGFLMLLWVGTQENSRKVRNKVEGEKRVFSLKRINKVISLLVNYFLYLLKRIVHI